MQLTSTLAHHFHLQDGLTPLHCAARSGHEGVVDLLIQNGAPTSSKTKVRIGVLSLKHEMTLFHSLEQNGLTALHMSAQGDHVECARTLLHAKAPVDDVTVVRCLRSLSVINCLNLSFVIAGLPHCTSCGCSLRSCERREVAFGS